MRTTKTTTRKVAKKKTKQKLDVRIERRRSLEERIRELDDNLQKIEEYRYAMTECLSVASSALRACVSMATTVKAFERDELKCVALLELKSPNAGATEGRRLELFRGQTIESSFTLQHPGPFELELVNMSRELCFMVSALYLGRNLFQGEAIRAFGDGQPGQVVQVKVLRP